MSTRKPKSQTFGIRLTIEERAELERRSGELAVGAYIKNVLFADGDKYRHRRARAPVQDKTSLAQILALLGQSNVGARLDVMVAAAENGTLIMDDETVAAIQNACAEVHAIRLLLMKALGFQVSEDEIVSDLSDCFNHSAQIED
ncbi:MAG: hypothetical protein OIF56_00055 [Cohaesibacter sp.]|nr:hypothetical protein [Cohaesibacter sp.]